MGRVKTWLAAAASLVTAGTAAGTFGVPPAAAGQRPAAHGAAVARRAHRILEPGRVLPARAGYMWSTSATGGPVSRYYAFDTAGGAVSMSAGQSGDYDVIFPGLGQAIANPAIDITRYGGAGACALATVKEAVGNPPALEVGADCFSLTGVNGSALFDLLVAQPVSAPNGVLDYDAVTMVGAQHGPGQYNSSHKTNSVRHLGKGRFQVTMPGPGTTGTTGTVKVSAINDAVAPGDCEIAGWHGTRTGQVIDVDCFAATGASQDQGFTVTYVRGNNLMGLNGATTADAFASRPTTARYQPKTQYDSNHHARVLVARLGQGAYQVFFQGSEGPGTVNGGDIQVSTVGHTDDHCYVVYWQQQHDPYARVECVNNHVVPVDSAFTIQWVVA